MPSNFRDRQGRVYKIAEIGGNHEGDFEAALKLTKLAADCNVNAIKFQIYSGDTLVNRLVDPVRNQHFKNFELTSEEYLILAKECASAGIDFLASVWNESLFDVFIPKMPIIKVGSGDATSFGLIKRLIGFNKPTIISTGLCNSEEVRELVCYIDSIDSEFRKKGLLCLMQCTSMYPIPDDEANLAVLDSYREQFGVSVGYSDHTLGSRALELAICRDVDVIEFHFTDERDGRSFRDHKVSLLPAEVRALNVFEDSVIRYMGSSAKSATLSEIESGHVHSFRRSIYAKRPISVGTVISENDIIALRPAVDSSSKLHDLIVGSIAASDIGELEPVLDKVTFAI